MQTYAVAVLDATGSMAGQEDRVVSSMNEYVEHVKTQSEGTHLTVFMFDSERWLTFFEGGIASWPTMKREDYVPGRMTPLYDAVGTAIGHADRLSSLGDRVMVMVDTDGYENASKEHTRASIKALVEQRKDAGWAFLLMSQGLDHKAAQGVAEQGSDVGMAVLPELPAAKRRNRRRAAHSTTAYFADGTQPRDGEVLEEDDEREPTSVTADGLL